MTYAKPEVVLVGRAVGMVQMDSKTGGTQDGPDTLTTGAYEADE